MVRHGRPLADGELALWMDERPRVERDAAVFRSMDKSLGGSLSLNRRYLTIPIPTLIIEDSDV